jgi:hypothetical protein
MAKIKQIFGYIKEYVVTHVPSKETLVRSTKRALHAGMMGALSGFVGMPINLTDPKKYLLALLIGIGTGFLVGIQKLISGYIKYDLK